MRTRVDHVTTTGLAGLLLTGLLLVGCGGTSDEGGGSTDGGLDVSPSPTVDGAGPDADGTDDSWANELDVDGDGSDEDTGTDEDMGTDEDTGSDDGTEDRTDDGTVDDAAGWAFAAEDLCAQVLMERGTAPESASGDLDDDMALYADWRSDVLAMTVSALAEVPGASDDAMALVGDLDRLAALEAQAVPYYLDGVIVSAELDAIVAEEAALADEVHVIADALGTPSCGAVVD